MYAIHDATTSSVANGNMRRAIQWILEVAEWLTGDDKRRLRYAYEKVNDNALAGHLEAVLGRVSAPSLQRLYSLLTGSAPRSGDDIPYKLVTVMKSYGGPSGHRSTSSSSSSKYDKEDYDVSLLGGKWSSSSSKGEEGKWSSSSRKGEEDEWSSSLGMGMSELLDSLSSIQYQSEVRVTSSPNYLLAAPVVRRRPSSNAPSATSYSSGRHVPTPSSSLPRHTQSSSPTTPAPKKVHIHAKDRSKHTIGLPNVNMSCWFNSVYTILIEFHGHAAQHLIEEISRSANIASSVVNEYFIQRETGKIIGAIKQAKRNGCDLFQTLDIEHHAQQDAGEFFTSLLNLIPGLEIEYTHQLTSTKVFASQGDETSKEKVTHFAIDLDLSKCFPHYHYLFTLAHTVQRRTDDAGDTIYNTVLSTDGKYICFHYKRVGYVDRNQFRKDTTRIQMPYRITGSRFLGVYSNGQVSASARERKKVYTLVAMIYHHGDGSNAGHYTSFVNNYPSQDDENKATWVEYDDDSTGTITYKELTAESDYSTPCVWIYELQDAEAGQPNQASGGTTDGS